jgi:L-ascorbate metabolism protein UlaG (beta-lactamase superfamily)
MKQLNKIQHISSVIKNLVLVKLKGKKILPNTEIVMKEWYQPSTPIVSSEKPLITWIGQSTFLIQVAGMNILTDPIFTKPSALVKRIVPPGLTLNDLPNIDVILVSHNHPDHMEKKSIIKLKSHNPKLLLPHNVGKTFYKKGLNDIQEFHWGDKFTLDKNGKKVIFTFLPASHWSGTNLFNINRSKYGSWMIEYNDKSIYFAGDTAYDKHFCEISQDFKNIHSALMPIGPVEPRHVITDVHIDGKEAINAFLDLKAQKFVPMHWGTFTLGSEEFDAPMKHLQKHWNNKQTDLINKELVIVKFGKSEIL